MASVGSRVEEAVPQGLERSFDISSLFWTADGGAAVRRLLGDAGTTEFSIPEPASTAALDAESLDRLMIDWYELRSEMSAYFTQHDLILCPVNARPAAPHDTMLTPDYPDYSYTLTYNATGWPGAVVRGGTSPEGLPIGVQVVGAPGREDQVLAVLGHLESVLGGFVPPPL